MTKTVFAGRRAIVTGAAQGIGRAIAERLHDGGAQVCLLDMDAALASAAASAGGFLLRPSGPAAPGISADVRVRKLTYGPGLEQEPTLSPDGNYVAYTTDEAGNLDRVQFLADGAEQPPAIVVDTAAPDSAPPTLDTETITITSRPARPEAPDGETVVTLVYHVRDDGATRSTP